MTRWTLSAYPLVSALCLGLWACQPHVAEREAAVPEVLLALLDEAADQAAAQATEPQARPARHDSLRSAQGAPGQSPLGLSLAGSGSSPANAWLVRPAVRQMP